jgi:hypothetical protein
MLHTLRERKQHTRFRIENVVGRERMEDLGVDGRTILKCILKNAKGWCGMDVPCSGKEPWQAPVTFGFKNTQEFLDSLKTYLITKQDFAT